MPKKNEVYEEPVVEQEQATRQVEDYKPVADFVAHVSPPVKPEPRISNLTRATHAAWKRKLRLLRGMGVRLG